MTDPYSPNSNPTSIFHNEVKPDNSNNTFTNQLNSDTNDRYDPLKYTKANRNNIGNNIVLSICDKKYVIGIYQTFFLYLLISFAIIGTLFSWVVFTYLYYSWTVYSIGIILLFFTILYLTLCFLTEPGIIPRNDPNFSSKNLSDDNKHLWKEDACDSPNEQDNSKSNEYNTNAEEERKENVKIKLNNVEKVIDNNRRNISAVEGSTVIPSIFKERYCTTCNIIRPSKTSHCSACDNCVQNFDHHCFFISNCVGARNHAYFFYFLFFGTLLGIYVSIFALVHVIYVFVMYPLNIFSLIISNNLFLFWISCAFNMMSLLFMFCGSQDFGCLLTPFAIGYSIFSYLFYTNRPEGEYPFYHNPFGFPVLVSVFGLGIFVGVTFVKQGRLILQGFTTKQYSSIQQTFVNNTSDEEFYAEYIRKKTFKEKAQNLWDFLTSRKIESWIDKDRDL